jgi:hypothetical protein
MKKHKRIIVATLSGLLCGFICNYLASSGDYELALPITLQIISSRTLIGFAIGISRLKMHHWAVHGLVMGAIFSLPLAFSGLMAESVEFSKTMMLVSTIGIGMVYGLLIELVTSVIFKARK